MSKVTDRQTELSLGFEIGQTAEGDPKLSHSVIRNVSPDASNDDIYTVGVAISGLQTKPLHEVVRINRDTLVAE